MDAELRRKVRCVLGYCEPNQHECLYESSRNYSQEFDEIDKLFQQEIAKAIIDEYKNHMPVTKYPNHYQVDKLHLDQRIAELSQTLKEFKEEGDARTN